MESLNATASQVLRTILAAQPTSAAKVRFAWTMAAGPALARAATADWRDDGVLVVRARTESWLRELRRARPVIAERLRQMLGEGVVRKIVFE